MKGIGVAGYATVVFQYAHTGINKLCNLAFVIAGSVVLVNLRFSWNLRATMTQQNRVPTGGSAAVTAWGICVD